MYHSRFPLFRTVSFRSCNIGMYYFSAIQIGNFEKTMQNLKVQLASAHGSHKEAIDQVKAANITCTGRERLTCRFRVARVTRLLGLLGYYFVLEQIISCETKRKTNQY